MQNTTFRKFAKFGKFTLGFASCAAVTVVAYASVAFDPSSGVGSVGKGDLQTAWGWNDHKLQACADGISFYYARSETASYSAVCVFTTGDGRRGEKTHHVEHKIDTINAVNSDVAHEAKKNTQGKVTGFKLNGWESATIIASGSVPVVGGPCPGNNGHDGVWESVVQTSSSTSGGGLYAVSDEAPATCSPLLIWSEPAL